MLELCALFSHLGRIEGKWNPLGVGGYQLVRSFFAFFDQANTAQFSPLSGHSNSFRHRLGLVLAQLWLVFIEIPAKGNSTPFASPSDNLQGVDYRSPASIDASFN